MNPFTLHLPDPPAKILWVGPDHGEGYRLLRESGLHMTTAAFSRETVHFPEGTAYDGIVFYQVAEHVSSLNHVLTESRRFLVEGGRVVLCDGLTEKSPVYAMKPSYLMRKLTMLLCENGFRILDRFEADEVETDSEKCNLKHGFFVARKDHFRIRSYMPGDDEKILTMFNEVFGTHRTMAHWRWKFRDNPFGSHRICLGFSAEGELVSQYAGYPIPFCSTLENRPLPTRFMTLHAGDTFTHPSVRRIGLGKTGLMARTTFYFYAAFLEGAVPFAFGFNTASIKKLGERYMGYQYSDPVDCWKMDLSSGDLKGPGVFSRLFSPYDVEEVFSVDETWDEFFDSVCADYSFLVARDAAYIRWRYLECPDGGHRLFALRRKGALAGWSVFSVKDGRILWGDALFDRRRLKGVSNLLHHAATRVFSGTQAMTAWFSKNPKWWTNHLSSLGFKPEPDPDGLTLCYKSFRSPMMGADTVTHRLHQSFYYTWGDSDLF